MVTDVSKSRDQEQLIGVFKVRAWQRGHTYIVTVPKEVVDRLGIHGQTKVQVLLEQNRRRIIYELME